MARSQPDQGDDQQVSCNLSTVEEQAIMEKKELGLKCLLLETVGKCTWFPDGAPETVSEKLAETEAAVDEVNHRLERVAIEKEQAAAILHPPGTKRPTQSEFDAFFSEYVPGRHMVIVDTPSKAQPWPADAPSSFVSKEDYSQFERCAPGGRDPKTGKPRHGWHREQVRRLLEIRGLLSENESMREEREREHEERVRNRELRKDCERRAAATTATL